MASGEESPQGFLSSAVVTGQYSQVGGVPNITAILLILQLGYVFQPGNNRGGVRPGVGLNELFKGVNRRPEV